MAAKATISSGYRWRLALVALVLLAMGSWFLYDGAAKYPREQQAYRTYESLRAEYGDTGWQEAWVETARANGWPTDQQPTERSDLDIWVQLGCAALTLPLGALFGLAWLRSGWRWVASDEQGLRTSRGQVAAWDSLRSVDKSRWKNKGIAVVHYEHDGRTGRITLDDWKFDREGTTAILSEVEAHLGIGADEEPASKPDSVGTPGASA